ncbi:hypothetical protein MIR68_007919 [Amoeboaphelidium protococcarum]|nr:hypothetical protein MIR68_007919 [Amoeboaphelidium protococcarum]
MYKIQGINIKHLLKLYAVVYAVDNSDLILDSVRQILNVARIGGSGSLQQKQLKMKVLSLKRHQTPQIITLYYLLFTLLSFHGKRNILVASFLSGAVLAGLPRRLLTDMALTMTVRAMDTQFQNEVSSVVSSSLFILSVTEIMYSWFYYPESLPPSYRSFISKFAEIDFDLLKLLRAFKEGQVWYGHNKLPSYLQDFYQRTGVTPAKDDCKFFECNHIVHPGIGCGQNAVMRLCKGAVKAFSMYGPLYMMPLIISTLLMGKKLTMRRLLRTLISAARSSLFIGTFIALIWGGICSVRNYVRNEYVFGPLIASFLSGFSIFIEHAHRRHELALYCLPRALYSFGYRLTQALDSDKEQQREITNTGKSLRQFVSTLTYAIIFSSASSIIVTRTFTRPKSVRPLTAKLVKSLLNV